MLYNNYLRDLVSIPHLVVAGRQGRDLRSVLEGGGGRAGGWEGGQENRSAPEGGGTEGPRAPFFTKQRIRNKSERKVVLRQCHVLYSPSDDSSPSLSDRSSRLPPSRALAAGVTAAIAAGGTAAVLLRRSPARFTLAPPGWDDTLNLRRVRRWGRGGSSRPGDGGRSSTA